MSRAPQTTNIEAARKFWDSHNIDEVEGEEVEIEVRRPLSHVLSVRLDNEDFETLIALAKKKKLGITTLARQLLHEGLAASRSNTYDNSERVVRLNLSKRQLSHIAAQISGTRRPRNKRRVAA